MILRVAKVTILLSLLTTSRSHYHSSNATYNATLQCLFHEPDGVLGTFIDYRWTSLSEFLYVASELMIFTGVAEFLCAQAPYSMRGLIVGIVLALLGIYVPIFNTVELIYEKMSLNWATRLISCGFWYLLTKISL